MERENALEDLLWQINGFEHRQVTLENINLLQERACPICMMDFAAGAIVTQTPCHHVFHYQCLLPYFFARKILLRKIEIVLCVDKPALNKNSQGKVGENT